MSKLQGLVFTSLGIGSLLGGAVVLPYARAKEGWMNAATENSLPRTNAVDSIKTRKRVSM